MRSANMLFAVLVSVLLALSILVLLSQYGK